MIIKQNYVVDEVTEKSYQDLEIEWNDEEEEPLTYDSKLEEALVKEET